jgi:L-aspartate oxidase
MGGVATDLEGRTTLAGVYAAGEVACTGVHGANRLASNSLLEGLVYGARAGRAMASEGAGRKHAAPPTAREKLEVATGAPANTRTPPEVAKRVHEIRRLLWENAGILRDAASLTSAVEGVARLERSLPAAATRAHYEESNLRTVGEAIARSGLAREESRGAHYRTDFPVRDDARWGKHSRVVAGQPVTFE